MLVIHTLKIITLLLTVCAPTIAYAVEAQEMTMDQQSKIYSLAGTNYHEAIALLENHIGNAEPTTNQLSQLCQNYRVAGRFGKMAASCNQLQHKSPDGRVLIRFSAESAQLIDKTSSAYVNIMWSYILVGEYDKAIVAGKYAQAAEADKHDVFTPISIRGALGSAYVSVGNDAAADEIVQHLRRLDAHALANPIANAIENHELEKQLIALINGSLFQIYLARGQFEQALIAFDKTDIPTSPALEKFFSDRGESAELNTMLASGKAKRGASRANILMELGRTAEALLLLDAALAHPAVSQDSSIYWTALFNRGRIADKNGQAEDAIRFYMQAVVEVEQQRASINNFTTKMTFVGDKQKVYGYLVNALVRAKRDGLAFEYAERAKARALLDMLASRSSPLQVRSDEARAVLANITQLQEELSVASSDERSQPDKTQKTRNLVVLASEQLQKASPELASLVTASPIDEARLRSLLQPDETLVEYYTIGDDLYAFVATQTTIRAVRLDGGGLSKQARAFRTSVQNPSSKDAKGLAGELYARLIAPLDLPAQGKLLVVPHGILHYVPFNALVAGKDFLIDRYSIRFLPSASVLAFLNQRKVTGSGLLIFGNPDLGNPELDLPGAEKEALQIAKFNPGSTLLTRANATKTAAINQAGKFAYLHFASHGKFNATQPLKSGLYLAKDKETGSSGTLTVDNLYSLNLNADLVTLSACETALGHTANGDDVIGLTRGFFYAGASSIIASLWTVDDEATYQIMTRYYKELDANSKTDALLKAQRAVKEKHPHPFYWAAFQLSGNR